MRWGLSVAFILGLWLTVDGHVEPGIGYFWGFLVGLGVFYRPERDDPA